MDMLEIDENKLESQSEELLKLFMDAMHKFAERQQLTSEFTIESIMASLAACSEISSIIILSNASMITSAHHEGRVPTIEVLADQFVDILVDGVKTKVTYKLANAVPETIQ